MLFRNLAIGLVCGLIAAAGAFAASAAEDSAGKKEPLVTDGRSL